MGKKEKLYRKAKDSPENLKFKELCSLAEFAGFEYRSQNGSHRIYKNPTIRQTFRQTLNFQPDKRDGSKAKKYQISQLISTIDEFDLLGED